MFWEESLGKIKFRAFPKRVGPRIKSLGSVDFFGAREHYWVVGKKNKNPKWQNCDGRVCKFSLYANESCDEHAIYFRRLELRAM